MHHLKRFVNELAGNYSYLPQGGVIIRVRGGIGEQFTRIVGGYHIADLLKKPLYTWWDKNTQGERSSSIFPIFPEIQMINERQLKSIILSEGIPLECYSFFMQENPNLGSNAKGIPLPEKLFYGKNSLAYLPMCYTSGRGSFLRSKEICLKEKKDIYILKEVSTFYTDSSSSITGALHNLNIGTKDPNVAAIHIRLGDRDPERYKGSTGYYSKPIEGYISIIKTFLSCEDKELHVFTDDPLKVYKYTKGFKRVTIVSPQYGGNSLGELLELCSYHTHLNTGVFSGFSEVAKRIRHVKGLPCCLA